MDLLFSPVQWISDWVTFGLLKLAPKSSLGSSLNFFIFDQANIFYFYEWSWNIKLC